MCGNISFIILNWNTKDLTKKCIKSIYKHIPTAKFELVLVDNGSTDGSPSYFKKYQSKYKNFKLVTNKTNLGFSAGNNIGVKMATGNILIFLNSDTELVDNSILKAINYLNNKPSVGLIVPRLVLDNKQTQNSVYPPQTLKNAIKEYWFGQKNSFTPCVPTGTKPTKIYSAVGAVFIIHTKLFKKVGDWNEDYFLYFEDMDLCQKIRKKNKTIVYYPNCTILHHHGQSGKNIASAQDQWKRLIPSSVKYHGKIKHTLLNLIIRLNLKLILLLLIAFVIKMYLSQFGNLKNGDLVVHLDWAQTIFKYGFKNFYFKTGWFTTPPTQPSLINFLFYISQAIYDKKYVLSQLHNLIKIPPTFFILWFDTHGQYVTLKLWPIMADILAGFLIYKIIKKYKNNKTALVATTFFLFNPLTVFESSIWGQNDILSAFMVTYSFIILKNRSTLSPLLFAFSLLTKPTTIILVPLYLVVYIKNHPELKTVVTAFFITLSFSLLSFLPFLRQGSSLLPEIKNIFINRIVPSSKGISLASVSAFNLYSAFFTIDKTLGSQKILLLKVNQLSTILFLLTTFLIIRKVIRDKNIHKNIFTYIFLTTQTIFIFTTSMLERYFFPGFIASSIVLFKTKNQKIKRLILLQYFIHFLNLIYAFYYRNIDIIKSVFQSHNLLLIRGLSLSNLIITAILLKKLLYEKTES